jgi:hypothetical protein
VVTRIRIRKDRHGLAPTDAHKGKMWDPVALIETQTKGIPEAIVSVPEVSRLRSYRSTWAMQPGGPVRP